jgi:hypothetical protein
MDEPLIDASALNPFMEDYLIMEHGVIMEMGLTGPANRIGERVRAAQWERDARPLIFIISKSVDTNLVP